MSCSSIDGLVLDRESIRAIEEIRNKQQIANYLNKQLSQGVLSNILLTNQSLTMAFNIYQTDFQLYTLAMKAVPTILKREVETIAGRQLLRKIDYKQRTFWKGIHYGCN